MKSHAIGINKFKLKKIILEVNKYIIISLLFQSFHIQLITNERNVEWPNPEGILETFYSLPHVVVNGAILSVSETEKPVTGKTAIRGFKFKKRRCESGWWRITRSSTQHIWSEHHPREIAQYACCERQASIVNCKCITDSAYWYSLSVSDSRHFSHTSPHHTSLAKWVCDQTRRQAIIPEYWTQLPTAAETSSTRHIHLGMSKKKMGNKLVIAEEYNLNESYLHIISEYSCLHSN